MSDQRKGGIYWAVLFAALAIGAGAWGYQQHRQVAELSFTQHRAALLQEENTRLEAALVEQQKGAAREYEVTQRKPIEEAIASIRHLEFAHPVVYDSLSRAGIKKIVEQKLAEEYSDQDFKNMAAGYAAFGLLEPGYPLKQKYIDLLGEQIAAFYDQHQHKLFMFEDATLRNSQNRVVLAHELTHALQDQNFGLLKMPLEVKNNDDLALATSALIEGDATVAMSDFMMKNISMQSLKDSFSDMLSQNMDQIQRSPRYLREMLMFPYLQGQRFCMTLKSKGGYQAISDAFRNPPTSTSQILHPAKYLAVPREDPVRVQYSDTSVNGKKPIVDNVLGEMGIRIFLSQWGRGATAAESASGWRGDRYLVFEDGGATELAWVTVWDSPAEADKFARALTGVLIKRYGPLDTSKFESPDMIGSYKAKNHSLYSSHGSANEVILIDATTDVWKDSLLQKIGTHGQN